MSDAASKIQVIRRKSSPVQKEDLDVREELCVALRCTINLMLTNPTLTKVTWEKFENTTVYRIHTIQEDFGRLIGVRGRNITALRLLTMAMSANFGFRAIIEIANQDEFLKR